MNVDPGFAQWLKDGVLFASADDAQVAAIWAAVARVTEVTSPLALKADADAEAARQAAFLGGPLAIDDHLVDGQRADLLGKAVTITSARLGYGAGASVFVIVVAEADDQNLTTLTVLRKLT